MRGPGPTRVRVGPPGPGTTNRRIYCTECNGPLDVSPKARSVSCEHCNARVVIENLKISGYTAVTRLATCGTIEVTKKGRLVATSDGGALEVRSDWRRALVNAGVAGSQLRLHIPGDTSSVHLYSGRDSPFSSHLTLWDEHGDEQFILFGGVSGNASVYVPHQSITAYDMLNEPGIAQGRDAGDDTLNTAAMVDVVTVSITTPDSGYIVLRGRSLVAFRNTVLANYAYLQIDETAGGDLIGGHFSLVGLNAYPTANNHYFDCSVQRTYKKPAGTYTFRLEGKKYDGGGNGVARCVHSVLTAIYYPTSYGGITTVQAMAGDAPSAESTPLADPAVMSQPQGGDLDLGHLELRLARAEAEAGRAQRELLEAELQMGRESDQNPVGQLIQEEK